jgi:uncharacterized phiE125 gp8 family phage protein
VAYGSLANLKTYLGITKTEDDAILTALLPRAQGIIDRYTGRTFEAVTQTRYYERIAQDWTDWRLLVVDGDLLTVTSLKNGDAAATVISPSDYWLWPFSAPSERAPYWGIRLKENGVTTGWEFDSDGRVEVTGTWGYSATAPADIEHATLRLAGYLYRQRDAQVFETTADPVTGQMTIPPGMPKDVRLILDQYRRLL